MIQLEASPNIVSIYIRPLPDTLNKEVNLHVKHLLPENQYNEGVSHLSSSPLIRLGEMETILFHMCRADTLALL